VARQTESAIKLGMFSTVYFYSTMEPSIDNRTMKYGMPQNWAVLDWYGNNITNYIWQLVNFDSL
jgi:hypothetical protein